MISISRLLCGSIGANDNLRYGLQKPDSSGLGHPEKQFPRPVVVWNCTTQCNLRCIHCYANATMQRPEAEMNTEEGKAFIRDLADFGVPVILFSGGEPLLRKDIFELASFAKELGIRPVLSTNGTIITERVADEIRRIDFAEVGISLDGIGEHNDRFRGKPNAYQEALQGIRNCVARGLRVSLRLVITGYNYQQIPAIFDLVEQERVNRICFYHLAYAGRGTNIKGHDLSHDQTRAVVDTICERTLDLHERGLEKEILTVANHTDGVYLYLKLTKENPQQAEKVLALLKSNGGNSSGLRIGAVDNLGEVHPDQFWWSHSFGNVRQRPFSEIWMDTSEPLMWGLRNRRELLKGRCARCHYLDLCNGNLRVRAATSFGDVWAEDPACYLTDEEIGLTQ